MTKLDDLINRYGIEKLNTMTKYPSILTYHELNRGGVRDVLTKPEEMPGDDELIIISEKVDGTNYRIVTTCDDWYIGSRDRFTAAYGDRLCTDELAKTVFGTAANLSGEIDTWGNLTVVYGEVYGWKIQKPRYNKGDDRTREFAVFDIWQMPLDQAREILEKPIDEIVAWREGNQQPWFRYERLNDAVDVLVAEEVPLWTTITAGRLPKGAKETQEWLQKFKNSMATFVVNQPHDMYGKAEGIVIRTADRSWIRKLRFEDYAKGERKEFK